MSWINEVIEEFGRDTPAETCLREAAEADYTGVETSRKFPTDPGALKDLLDGFGLGLASGWHSGRLAEDGVEAEMTAVADHARLLSAMGCKVMVYGETATTRPTRPPPRALPTSTAAAAPMTTSRARRPSREPGAATGSAAVDASPATSR